MVVCESGIHIPAADDGGIVWGQPGSGVGNRQDQDNVHGNSECSGGEGGVINVHRTWCGSRGSWWERHMKINIK